VLQCVFLLPDLHSISGLVLSSHEKEEACPGTKFSLLPFSTYKFCTHATNTHKDTDTDKDRGKETRQKQTDTCKSQKIVLGLLVRLVLTCQMKESDITAFQCIQ